MTIDAPVPVFTLARAVERIRPDLEARWSGLLDSQRFVGGDEVERFERAFADFLDASACVGVANGTRPAIVNSPGQGLVAAMFRPGLGDRFQFDIGRVAAKRDEKASTSSRERHAAGSSSSRQLRSPT